MKAATDVMHGPSAASRLQLARWTSPGLWLTLLAVAALGAWPLATGQASLRETIFTTLQAIALASSLNIILGLTGYVSFGHVVFFGLGGYVGMLAMSAGAPLWVAMPLGGLAAGLLAYGLGAAILRLRGAYFALATIGINEAMRALITNLSFFGGATGISLNFSTYNSYGGAANALWLAYGLMLAITLAVILLSYAIKTSKFGLGLMAIREDEDAAEVMGVTTPRAKTWAYVLSAIAPGIIGVIFFFKNGNIEPADAFRLHISIEMIVMVMLGGQGSVVGAVLGSVGYQRLRVFLLTNDLFKDLQLVIAGVLLLLIVLFIPAGIVGLIRRKVPALRKFLV